MAQARVRFVQGEGESDPERLADDRSNFVGTLIGESTSTEFRLALTHEEVREQDIIAVDARLRDATGVQEEVIRVWAKVQQIERLNPLFPMEAGHELAATRTNPMDTIISMSREMVTAVCRVLGFEPITGDARGKLSQLRYPPQPASTAYRPDANDIARIVIGGLDPDQPRALDVAVLANRPEVNVLIDGHAIVTRHLAILAMTGAGKSWAARRIIEQLSAVHYPMVIFDPHGDYTGLAEALPGVVDRYYANFPVFEEDDDTVIKLINSLGYELSPTMESMFSDLFRAADRFLAADITGTEVQERTR